MVICHCKTVLFEAVCCIKDHKQPKLKSLDCLEQEHKHNLICLVSISHFSHFIRGILIPHSSTDPILYVCLGIDHQKIGAK